MFAYQMRILIDVNQTERIEAVVFVVCNEFGFVLNVWSGAVHEYKVNAVSHFFMYALYLLTNRMSLIR